jgi:uncharacterized protein
VGRLLERYRVRPVVARVTVTKGGVEVARIFEHLMGLGFFEVGFSPVTAAAGAPHGLDALDLDELLGQFKALGALYVERALRGEFTGFSNLSALLTDIHGGTAKTLPCGAGLGLLDVDARGGLYLCHRFSGSEDYRFGSVHEGGVDEARLGGFLGDALAAKRPVCSACWIRGVCAGGCYHEAHTTLGDARLPNLHYCEWLRDWTEYGVGVYAEIERGRPGFVERVVARGRADAPRELG